MLSISRSATNSIRKVVGIHALFMLGAISLFQHFEEAKLVNVTILLILYAPILFLISGRRFGYVLFNLLCVSLLVIIFGIVSNSISNQVAFYVLQLAGFYLISEAKLLTS